MKSNPCTSFAVSSAKKLVINLRHVLLITSQIEWTTIRPLNKGQSLSRPYFFAELSRVSPNVGLKNPIKQININIIVLNI